MGLDFISEIVIDLVLFMVSSKNAVDGGGSRGVAVVDGSGSLGVDQL